MTKTSNRLLSALLALVMVVCLLPAGALTAKADAPIEISTAEALLALGEQTLTGTYSLTADIDMAGLDMKPIAKLTGNFNGNGHTISNLTINHRGIGEGYGTKGVALFAAVQGTISDLRLDHVNISTPNKSYAAVGGLVGVVDSVPLTITNCAVTGTLSAPDNSSSDAVGGLVGAVQFQEGRLAVQNSFCSADISCGMFAGGLVGKAESNCTVNLQQCAFTGTVQSSSTASTGTCGGIIGQCNAGFAVHAEQCYLTGDCSGGGAYLFASVNKGYGDFEKSITLTDCAYDALLGSHRSAITANQMTTLTGTMEAKSADELAALTQDILSWPKTGGGSTEEVIPDTHISVSPDKAELKVYQGTDASGTLMKADNRVNGRYTYKLEKGDYFWTATAFDHEPASGRFTVTANSNDFEVTLKPTPGWKEQAAQTIAAGDGTEASPYQIGTAEELACLSNKIDNGESSAHAVLTADIDLKNLSWQPMGKNTSTNFSGVFDGQGHTISGLNVSRDANSYFGLFGCLKDATVKSLTISGAVYSPENSNMVGGLAGAARGNVTISDCANLCNITSGAGAVGGLIGSYNKGIAYQNPSVRLLLERCFNTGSIKVTGRQMSFQIGGLVGTNENCTQLVDCYNVGTVSGDGMVSAGLLGSAGSTTGECSPSITNCYNAGTVTGNSSTDPIYGKNYLAPANITNCFTLTKSARKGVQLVTKEQLTADKLGENWVQSPDENNGLPHLRNSKPELPDETLLAEADKYRDTVAVPGSTQIGDALVLLKDGQTADETITLTCTQTVDDTQHGYVQCENGTIRLKKVNETMQGVTETATLTFSRDGKVFHKPITIVIQPSASQSGSLMENIAATYPENANEWVIFDMAVYNKVCPDAVSKTTEETLATYRDVLISQTLPNADSESALLSEKLNTRTKAEIILGTLGLDTTKLTAYAGTANSKTYNAAEKVAPLVNELKDRYSAPWVLLADQHGKTKLTPAQVQSMVKLLTDNQQENGLNCYIYYGKTYDDVDTTATALAAFAAYYLDEGDSYGVKAAVSKFIPKAIAGLSAVQQDNGSFGNVNSDAMAIIGLISLGIDPDQDARFVKDGGSLAKALNLYVNEKGNGFKASFYSSKPEEMAKATALATEQGFRALVALEAFNQNTAQTYNIYTQTRAAAPEIGTNPGGGEVDPTPTPGPDGDFTVTLSLLPDPIDAPWIAETTYTFTEGETVFDLFQTAATENGITYVMNGNYVKSMTKDGITLAAGAHGYYSGWMYDVNNKLPSTPMNGCKLNKGDVITIFYGRDDQVELKALDLGDIPLNPKFNPQHKTYEATTTADSVTVHAERAYEHATVTIEGADHLICGENVVTVTVSFQEMQPNVYTITVTKPHTPVHHEAVAPTCLKTGMKEYWSCSGCGKLFSDDACTKEVSMEQLVLAKTGHTPVHHEAVAPTCSKTGMKEYWSCSGCNKLFSDEACSKVVLMNQLVIPMTDHTPVHHEAVAPTCSKTGMKEYWSCSGCGKLFSDEACSKEVTTSELVIPILEHNWGKTTYNWAADGKSCTATRICTNDASHTQTASAIITSKVTKQPTYTTKGETTYTATFETIDWAEPQSKTVTDIPQLVKPTPDPKPDFKPTPRPDYHPLPTPSVHRFRDVHDVHHWAEPGVDFVVEKGLFQGISYDLFAPDSTMTRAMMMTVLARLDGVNTQGGVTWYEKGLNWAKQSGISDGSNPEGTITREQLVTMLYRYAGKPIASGSLDGFSDADQVSAYARDAMIWAVETGLIKGMDGRLEPAATATRGQVATMLMRYCKAIEF